ncbi:unnamed protein product [Cladocopium goreaui]|uniref:Potassium voltage-gated channel subfamily A member 6 n=1 Tax=Cladocopium goreaui TaxID=2562237 RepID=A0A9P1BQ46_9DINO|nr:unnamed protein product [Cladocopium goreaui]
MFSSSFLHGTHSHFLREAFLMILAGVPLEVEIGTWFFMVVFLICGAVGCSCSWLTLRWTLRRNPDFSQMPREHVDAIANLSNSRGASACVYGIAVLAVLLVGDQGLAQFFGISPETGNGLLLAARFIPEIFSPLSTRLRSYPLPFGSVFLVLLLVAFSLPAELTVSNSLLFWFFVHCFFRAYPSLLALGPPREFAATDYLGHIYGALAALLLGGWHLLRRLTVGSPHLQSWLALTVLYLKIHCRRSTGFSQGSSSSLLLAPCGVDGVSSGGFARFAAEPERLRRFLREVLEVVEKVEGHENYHLRLTAGSAPPSDLAAQNPEEMEKLIQRAGFSVFVFADAARKQEPADADALLDLDAQIDYQDASGKHVKLPITSRDITVLQGDLTRCALDAQGRPMLVVVLERFVQFQRDCTDAELLELWSLASKAMDVTAPGRQEGDLFLNMRLNAGTFQNCRHLHLKVYVDSVLFETTWASHPGYQVLKKYRDERRTQGGQRGQSRKASNADAADAADAGAVEKKGVYSTGGHGVADGVVRPPELADPHVRGASSGADSAGKGSQASDNGGKGRMVGRGRSPNSESSTPSLMPPPVVASQAWSTDESSGVEEGDDRFGDEPRRTSSGYMKRRRASRASASGDLVHKGEPSPSPPSDAVRGSQVSRQRASFLESLSEGVANLWSFEPREARTPPSRDSIQSTVLVTQEGEEKFVDEEKKEAIDEANGHRGSLFLATELAQSLKRLSSDLSAGVASMARHAPEATWTGVRDHENLSPASPNDDRSCLNLDSLMNEAHLPFRQLLQEIPDPENNPGGILSAFPQLKRLQGATQAPELQVDLASESGHRDDATSAASSTVAMQVQSPLFSAVVRARLASHLIGCYESVTSELSGDEIQLWDIFVNMDYTLAGSMTVSVDTAGDGILISADMELASRRESSLQRRAAAAVSAANAASCADDLMEEMLEEAAGSGTGGSVGALTVEKMDICIEEVMQLKRGPRMSSFQARSSIISTAPRSPRSPRSPPPPSPSDLRGRQSSAQAIASGDTVAFSTLRVSMCKSSGSQNSGDRPSFQTGVPARPLSKRGFKAMDLDVARRLHAQQVCKDIKAMNDPDMMVQQSRADRVWELLDDPRSSKAAWLISQFLKFAVVFSVGLTTYSISEEVVLQGFWRRGAQITFDVIFFLEFALRFFSAPSKKSYLSDPLNWGDVLSAMGLPVLCFSGFAQSVPETKTELRVQQFLLLFLPLARFLKLLRYFESFRLLVDAFAKSAEALPVLTYIMAFIVLLFGTAIYVQEDRSNIPSMPHSLWLALVTMTTVGYGDYFPVSMGGYWTVSALTFVSVLFLALPVGIIGHEFNVTWQKRAEMLLKTRLRNALAKFGYSFTDVEHLFDFADEDADGQLQLSEFIELIRQMRIGVSVETAAKLFHFVDSNEDGLIDRQEFIRNVFPDEYAKHTQQIQDESFIRSKRPGVYAFDYGCLLIRDCLSH